MNSTSTNGPKKRKGGRNPLPEGKRTRGRTLHMTPTQWDTLDDLGGGHWLRGEMDRKSKSRPTKKTTAQAS